ncbi:class I adenylate-forming enzyme family protein [Sphingobium tyrosinilyticum]|uniref:Class I adenylate-forming enzyme family protein n=1 Tax=Sphingobium tyrosinilyticum TaxID=2715436 RepID=A0ABV9F3D7_9SPHN
MVIDDPMSEEIGTLGQMVRAAAQAYGDEVAIRLTGDNIAEEEMSFVALERESARLARGLLARGVGKGSRIGFIYGNGPSFAVTFAAIARLGAIAVPISTLIKAEELVRVLRQSDVHGLLVQRTLLGHDYIDRLCAALPELWDATRPDLLVARVPFLRWIVSSGDHLPAAIHGMDWLSGAAERVDEAFLKEVEAEVHPSDQMLEIYTSGSMALPKGVKHLHGPAMFRSRYLAKMTQVKRGAHTIASMPMFWIGGMAMFLLADWVAGGVTVCTEGTSTSSRHAMGAVLTDDVMKEMGHAPVFWGLGMSETFGPYSYGRQLRAAGYPLCPPLDHVADRYEIRVVDEEGNPVTDGETGEIQVRGYALAPALHKLERHPYYTTDGFLRTGDLGRVEERPEGRRINFVGRDGDIIKTNGSNVSPAEVEMELQRLPQVGAAYVFGLPDDERGQVVVAALVAEAGQTLDFVAIEKDMRARLSSFKVPRAYVEISREDIPMLHSNKVARRPLQALIADRLGRAA